MHAWHPLLEPLVPYSPPPGIHASAKETEAQGALPRSQVTQLPMKGKAWRSPQSQSKPLKGAYCVQAEGLLPLHGCNTRGSALPSHPVLPHPPPPTATPSRPTSELVRESRPALPFRQDSLSPMSAPPPACRERRGLFVLATCARAPTPCPDGCTTGSSGERNGGLQVAVPADYIWAEFAQS